MSDLFGNHIVGFPTRRLNIPVEITSQIIMVPLDSTELKKYEAIIPEKVLDPIRRKSVTYLYAIPINLTISERQLMERRVIN